MELIFTGCLLVVMVIIFLLAMIMKGSNLTSAEEHIRSIINSARDNDEEVEDKYTEAYEIVMEFGDLLAAEKNLEQYYGVKDIYDRVEEFRAENHQPVEQEKVALKTVR